jgi:hypothetical protein
MTRLRYALLLCGSLAWGQTQIDLRTQSKSVDFSSAATTKTAKTGAALPASCSQGEIFFNISATPGANLYACTATNTWTAQGGIVTPNYSKPFTSATTLSISGAEHLLNTNNLVVTCYDASTPARMIEPDSITVDPTTYNVTVGFAQPQSGRCVVNGNSIFGTAGPGASGAQFVSQLLDMAASLNSTNTTLTIGAGCSTATPCNVRFGNAVYALTSPATATLSSGATGIAFIYVGSDGSVNVGSSMSIVCSGCNAISGVASYPVNTIPLYTWTATNGIWAGTGTDKRAMLSTKILGASTGLTTADTGSQTTIGIDTAVVPTYVSAGGSLNFGTINNGACSTEMTFSAPRTLTGDGVAPGWPPSLPAGVLGRMRIVSNGTAGVQLCNFSGAAVSVSANFQLTVVRSF